MKSKIQSVCVVSCVLRIKNIHTLAFYYYYFFLYSRLLSRFTFTGSYNKALSNIFVVELIQKITKKLILVSIYTKPNSLSKPSDIIRIFLSVEDAKDLDILKSSKRTRHALRKMRQCAPQKRLHNLCVGDHPPTCKKCPINKTKK